MARGHGFNTRWSHDYFRLLYAIAITTARAIAYLRPRFVCKYRSIMHLIQLWIEMAFIDFRTALSFTGISHDRCTQGSSLSSNLITSGDFRSFPFHLLAERAGVCSRWRGPAFWLSWLYSIFPLSWENLSTSRTVVGRFSVSLLFLIRVQNLVSLLIQEHTEGTSVTLLLY